MAGLGVKIGAHKHPGKLELYRPPAPLQGRWEPGRFGGYQQVTVDPEDNPNAVLVGEAEWSI